MTIVEISTVAGNLSLTGAASAALVIAIWKWPKMQAEKRAERKMELEYQTESIKARNEHSKTKDKTHQEIVASMLDTFRKELAAHRKQCWTEHLTLLRAIAPNRSFMADVAEAIRTFPENGEETPNPDKDDSERDIKTPA